MTKSPRATTPGMPLVRTLLRVRCTYACRMRAAIKSERKRPKRPKRLANIVDENVRQADGEFLPFTYSHRFIVNIDMTYGRLWAWV